MNKTKLFIIMMSVGFLLASTSSLAYAAEHGPPPGDTDGTIFTCEPTPTVTAIPNETSVLLTWSPTSYCIPVVTDEGIYAEIIQPTQYIVVELGVFIQFPTNELSMIIEDLESNTEYTFSVNAMYTDYFLNQVGYVTFTTHEATITEDEEEEDPVIVVEVEEADGGDASNKHKTRPTFGVSHETNAQFVTGGFTFNENTFDITHNFWTPFEIQTIKIGEINTISSTVFAPKELHVQEFLFGIPVVGEAHKAELGIEIFYTNQGVISNINIVQETNIIDVDSLVVTYTESPCSSTDDENLCDTTVLDMVFLEPLRHNVMALKAIDYKARTQITYLNHGFDISGESLNPMVTKMIPGPEKYEGTIKVTQTAKYSNIWLSEDNRAFTSKDAEAFVMVYQPTTRLSDPNTNTMTRMHSHFDEIKDMENYKASIVMKSLCSKCGDESFDKINDIFAYEYPDTVLKSGDTELQKILDSENLRGQKIIDEMFASYYPSKVFN